MNTKKFKDGRKRPMELKISDLVTHIKRKKKKNCVFFSTEKKENFLFLSTFVQFVVEINRNDEAIVGNY